RFVFKIQRSLALKIISHEPVEHHDRAILRRLQFCNQCPGINFFADQQDHVVRMCHASLRSPEEETQPHRLTPVSCASQRIPDLPTSRWTLENLRASENAGHSARTNRLRAHPRKALHLPARPL